MQTTYKFIRHFATGSLLLGALALTSCSKKLTETVYSASVPGNFYQTSAQVASAYVQPYAFLQSMMYDVHFTIEEFPTDEAVATVKNAQGYDDGQWIRLHQHTWTATEPFVLYEWSNLFQGIGYCNNFINTMAKLDLTKLALPVPKEQMMAEIAVMRAQYYYWAMDVFGNVPISTDLAVVSPPTRPRAQVFAFVDSSIRANLPLLGEKGDATWYGHWTKSAAHALLAKLYLNGQVFSGTDRYADCIKECDSVIDGGQYSLDPNWNDPFLVANENSNENIWVIPYDFNYAPGFNAAQEQLPGAMKDVYGFVDYPWGKTVTQESFYDLFDSTDKRVKQWIVGPQFYPDGTTPVDGWYDQDGQQLTIDPHIDQLNNQNGGYGQGVRNVKYEVPYADNSSQQMEMNNDMVVLRLADIMMAKAEALMRTNGNAATQPAVDLVNAVRARSFDAGNPKAKYTIATLTLDELLNERGREFAYEMKRREDLIRFGKFEQAWWEKPADADAHREIYPVPQNILSTSPVLVQNPQY